MSRRLIFILFIMVSLITIHGAQSSQSGSQNFRTIEKKILDSIIGPGRYDNRIRPLGTSNGTTEGLSDGPVLVHVDMFIRSISKIDDVKMEYSVQMTLREQWNDDRMQFDNVSGKVHYLTLTDPDKVWKPDLFFSNEKEGRFHNIIMPNVLLRIYPNGDVLYSIRVSLVLSCSMNLRYFPLDKQTCSIIMVSYGYTTEDLVFLWKKEDPVQLVEKLHLARFTLETFSTGYCTSRTNTGEYSCLKVDLQFKREFSYYLIQIYIPCCMLVIVSWVSFWLDPNAIPARVSLGITTLLTMATQISSINKSLPPVSYTKAIDVWTGVCLTFVFGALLEFALVNYASRSEDQKKLVKQKKYDIERPAALEADQQGEVGSSGYGMKPLVQAAELNTKAMTTKIRECEVPERLDKRKGFFPCGNWWLQRFPTRSKRIDVISRICFPLAFAIFNFGYWITYLLREDVEKN